MKCSHCGTDNLPEACYCESCGNSLESLTSVEPTQSGYRKGNFGRRFSAYMIDYFLLGAFCVLFFKVIGVADDYKRYSYGFEAFQGMSASPGFSFFSLLAGWLYFSLMESLNSATLGKLVLGLRVVDSDGCMISFGKATGRFFSRILSGLLLCIGFLVMLFDKDKETMHDKMTGTQVIEVEH